MKRIFLLMMLTVCCHAQTGVATTGPAQPVTITEDMNGQTVEVKKGDEVVVTFVSASGTGYAWQMEPTELATVKEDDVAERPGLPGGLLKAMFHVTVKQTVTLKFDYFRAWEKDKPPAKTFSVTVRISG